MELPNEYHSAAIRVAVVVNYNTIDCDLVGIISRYTLYHGGRSMTPRPMTLAFVALSRITPFDDRSAGNVKRLAARHYVVLIIIHRDQDI